jgi:Tfp pilus assembly protein PilX
MVGSSRQRGFSLIVVFLLVIVMVGIATTVLVSTQADLQVAGVDRESSQTFYAAEAGIAWAKDWLSAQPVGTGSTAWSGLLASDAVQLCLPTTGAAPGIAPKSGQVSVPYYATPSGAPPLTSYQWCVHNNSADPNYQKNPPTGDTADSDGILAIESYGYGPNNATTRLYVEVMVNGTTSPGGDYAQGGGGELKQARGEGGTIDTTRLVTF